jgi:hypothetical protein
MKKGSRRRRQDQIDEHTTPTEPLPDNSAMHFPVSNEDHSPSWDRTTAAPFSPPSKPGPNAPFLPGTPPGGNYSPWLTSPYSDQRQPPPMYPYTQNPSPGGGRYPYPFFPGNPPGGNYGSWPGDAARSPERAKKQHTRQRRLLLACVSLFFICLQLLLVVRFVIRLLSLSPNIAWVNVLTTVSEIFVLPFRALWFQIPSVGTLLQANIELYTLIAILIYGMLSRLLVGILKLMSKSR